jgi:hypothetical protein
MTSDKRFMCGACKKLFSTKGGASAHIEQKHRTAGAWIFEATEQVKGNGRSDHESFADRAIQANIAILSGERTDDAWLLP